MALAVSTPFCHDADLFITIERYKDEKTRKKKSSAETVHFGAPFSRDGRSFSVSNQNAIVKNLQTIVAGTQLRAGHESHDERYAVQSCAHNVRPRFEQIRLINLYRVEHITLTFGSTGRIQFEGVGCTQLTTLNPLTITVVVAGHINVG